MGPDNKVYDGGDDDDRDGVRNDDGDESDYVDDDHDDLEDEEDGVWCWQAPKKESPDNKVFDGGDGDGRDGVRNDDHDD